MDGVDGWVRVAGVVPVGRGYKVDETLSQVYMRAPHGVWRGDRGGAAVQWGTAPPTSEAAVGSRSSP